MGMFRGKNPIYNKAFVRNARENRTLINKLIKKLDIYPCDEDVLEITNQLKIVSIRLVSNTDAIAKREYEIKKNN